MKIRPAPNRLHLGDIINIIQRHSDCNFIYGGGFCRCCNNDVRDTVEQVLSLLDVNLKLTDDPTDAVEVWPSWSNSETSWDQRPYLRSPRKLPKKNHIACQFDARSGHGKLPAKIEVEIFKNRGLPLIDLGDSSGLGIREKFDVLASAKFYVGVDSGITHLALMTDTPVLVMSTGCRRRYYPNIDQIKFFTRTKDVFQCMQISDILFQ